MKSPRTAADRRNNATKLKQAEAIRAQREISLINEQYGFLDKSKGQMSVLEYFYSILQGHDKKWRIVYEHFNIFVKGKCTFDEITVDFCNKFREYLSTTKRIKSDTLKLSQNSAAGYWSTFRAFLAIAFKEGYLTENVNDYLDKLDTQETKREYLTMEELTTLAKSECDFPVLKNASIFSCLTGLRLSDILQLEWSHIQDYPGGGKCIRIKTEKTDTEATMRHAIRRTNIQRSHKTNGQQPPETMDQISRHRQIHHFPLLPPHLRHPAHSRWHRHLHRKQNAHPQKRQYNPNLRRPCQREEKGCCGGYKD